EEVEVLGKQLPDAPRVLLHRAAVERRDAETLEGDALRVEHARHVVVGDDEQRCRVGEPLVGREQLRIDVAVRADEGKACDAFVQRRRDAARLGLRIEVAVRVQHVRECTAGLPPVAREAGTIISWLSTNARSSPKGRSRAPAGSSARGATAPTTTRCAGCAVRRRTACPAAPTSATARSSPSCVTTCCASTTR